VSYSPFPSCPPPIEEIQPESEISSIDGNIVVVDPTSDSFLSSSPPHSLSLLLPHYCKTGGILLNTLIRFIKEVEAMMDDSISELVIHSNPSLERLFDGKSSDLANPLSPHTSPSSTNYLNEATNSSSSPSSFSSHDVNFTNELVGLEGEDKKNLSNSDFLERWMT
jgi:hypothetical protein